MCYNGEAGGERISEILTPQIAGVLLDHLNFVASEADYPLVIDLWS